MEDKRPTILVYIKIGDKHEHERRGVRGIGEEDKSEGFERRSEEERDKDRLHEEDRHCQATTQGSTGRTSYQASVDRIITRPRIR